MTTDSKPIKADDLWRTPDGNYRRELVRGELRMMAPAGGDHGAVTNNLAFFLTAHVRSHGLGQVFAAETGFRLKQSPDTVRGADVAFIRTERIPPEGRPKGFWEIPPDLAVEVLSPNDTIQEIEDKVDDYLSAGTQLVWVVNPKRRTVTVYQPDAGLLLRSEGETLDGGQVVPGFQCRVGDIFI